MYEKYLLQLEEAGKIRNLKERSINCYKNYVSYFLNYMEKHPEELTCQVICTLFTGQPVRRVFLCVIVMSLN